MARHRSRQKSTRARLKPPVRPPRSRRSLQRLATEHWRDATAFYDRNKSRLLRDPRYRNRFVAIRYGRVVDVDDDKFVLADRLAERFPDRIFFVTQVLRHEPVIHIEGVITE